MIDQFMENLIDDYETGTESDRDKIRELCNCNLNDNAWLLKTFEDIDEEVE